MFTQMNELLIGVIFDKKTLHFKVISCVCNLMKFWSWHWIIKCTKMLSENIVKASTTTPSPIQIAKNSIAVRSRYIME